MISNRTLLAAQASVLAMAMAATAAPAFAQTEIEELVVTARKRDEALIDVPFSIAAQSEQMMRERGVTNIEELSRGIAGFTVQNLGPGQSQIAIRGISAGQLVRDQPGVKEQVGVYLDESVISLSLFTPDLDLFDLNRVETLRGPQGTLFGSGSVGGTIRYITNQPKLDKTEGSVEGNVNFVGDDFAGHLKAAVNLPIGDKVAIRAVGYYTNYGGFINARREGGAIDKNVNNGSRIGGRIAVTIAPTDNITITPRVIYQKIDTNGFNRQEVFNLYANPFTTTRPKVTFNEREQFLLLREGFNDKTVIADNTMKFGFGGVDLTSVSSYTKRDILVSRDASALTNSVNIDLGFSAADSIIPSNLKDTTDVKSFTQELRLSSNGDGPFQWVLGGFYSNTDRNYAQRLPTPGYDDALARRAAIVNADANPNNNLPPAAAVANGFPLNSPYNSDINYKIKQKAVFGEASYDISEKLNVTAGGRYYDFSEDRLFKSGGLFANGDNQTGTTKSDGFTPRLLASYKATDDVTFNAQASKGFRLGGINDPLNIPLCSGGAAGIDALTFGNRPRYADETLWNYELGVKSKFSGITLNAAAFYTDITNLQVTADAGSCSSRVVFNVPKAHTQGIEFELTARPATGLELGISGSLLSAKFDSSVTTTAGVVIAGIRDNNRLPTVPKFQISANASYNFPVSAGAEGFVGASFQHVGNRITQPSDQEGNPRTFTSGLAFGGATGTGATTLNLVLPSYQLVNLNAGVDFDGGLSVTAYVNNVLDENALLSFDRERGGRARLGFATNQPRTYGITVRQAF